MTRSRVSTREEWAAEHSDGRDGRGSRGWAEGRRLGGRTTRREVEEGTGGAPS